MKLYSLISTVVIVFFVNISSIHAKIFNGYIVTTHGDTITCQLNVQVNIFYDNLVNSLSCKRKLKVIHADGQKKTYLTQDIKSFTIFNTSEGTMTYESHVVEGESCFIQVIHKGQFEVYKYYYPHGYDGSCQHYYTIRKTSGPLMKLAPIGWRAKLHNTFPEDEYFAREKLEKNYKYEQIPEFFERHEN